MFHRYSNKSIYNDEIYTYDILLIYPSKQFYTSLCVSITQNRTQDLKQKKKREKECQGGGRENVRMLFLLCRCIQVLCFEGNQSNNLRHYLINSCSGNLPRFFSLWIGNPAARRCWACLHFFSTIIAMFSTGVYEFRSPPVSPLVLPPPEDR